MDIFKNVVLFLDSFEQFRVLCNSNIMHILCMKCNRVTSCYSNFRDIAENAQSREERNCFGLFVVAHHDLSKYVNYYVLHSSHRNIDCYCEQNIKRIPREKRVPHTSSESNISCRKILQKEIVFIYFPSIIGSCKYVRRH